ncbi:hypothetical protein E5Q_05794 [Mixia osmundae IAM 14324]|uniref:AAA+ ATPase domain-containing protein n=1 Tax=Mixia osmundae (strain CBS 9802 / IAM 14324 / JCM 22182 / KY 12970) TaxID=764103 RepID=G7E8E6_MIXOS|nr:hypothetical protein E5Q_05794 [Mixia osmundae IAM 14324]
MAARPVGFLGAADWLRSSVKLVKSKAVVDFTVFLFSQVLLFYGAKYVFTRMLDPQAARKRAASSKSSKTLKLMGKRDLDLSEHEMMIAAEVIYPEDIKTGFSDVGGLELIVDELREAVIYPLMNPMAFQSTSDLFSAPKGVLLHGPPGCGKTMLAKALAKESGATFINIKVSTLLDKWLGESNKLVAALFSLAHKVQPSIIFIDEIDSFLRERSRNDHEQSGMMKAEFMSSWDGLTTGKERIIVLGATNRPNDIDAAILRRMPKRFAVRLPDAKSRRSILNLILKDIPLERNFNWDSLIRLTDGMSGSGLKEMCRNAVMVPVREELRRNGRTAPPKSSDAVDPPELKKFDIRPVRTSDFFINGRIASIGNDVPTQDGLD